MPVISPRYCPLCGAPLEPRTVHGAERPVCPACEFVHYADPKVAVGVLVEDASGALLYTLRAHQPAMGQWAWPSGFVDAGEDVEDAARREVREETGLDVAIDGLLGVFSRAGNPVIFIAYRGHATGGALRAGAEALEVRFFPLPALPPLTFPTDAAVLQAWQAARGEC